MIKSFKSTFLIPIKIFITFFIIFCSSIATFFLYLLILFSVKDVELKTGYLMNGLKKICNFKLENYYLDFSSINFKKTPIGEFRFNFDIWGKYVNDRHPSNTKSIYIILDKSIFDIFGKNDKHLQF